MNEANWARVRDLFERALEVPEQARATFVEHEAGADVELAAQVRQLFASEDPCPEFLTPPTRPGVESGKPPALVAPVQAGQQLGKYQIVGELGSGGMGTVYEAAQENPARRIALKVLRGAVNSPSARQRFQVEADILGRLQHPGIASIFEMGFHDVDPSGDLPYLAMELVEGARDVKAYCDDEQLSVSQRIALFREICAAVHYAHQQGIIHRDLKPGNVLVDSAGRARVIDYGVALAVEPGRFARPETQAGMVFGTLQYMSPEQLQGDGQVDIRCDVYALGAILYELLVGRPAHALRGRAITDVVREICEDPPVAPSNLRPGLAVELDWVVLKSLAKERSSRYGTAAELALDLERFAANEPVSAGPPTRRYRLRKFIRRNRSIVAASSLAVASLVAGLIAVGFAWVEANDQRARAEKAELDERERARSLEVALQQKSSVVDVLGDFVAAVSPLEDGRQVTFHQLLERNRHRLSQEFVADPEVRTELQAFFAAAYLALQVRDSAEKVIVDALAALDELDEPQPERRGYLMSMLARLRLDQGRFEDAAELIEQSLHAFERAGAPASAHVIWTRILWAEVLNHRGRIADSIQLQRELVELAEGSLGATHWTSIRARSNLAVAVLEWGNLDEAEDLARAAYEDSREVYGDRHPVPHEAQRIYFFILTERRETAGLAEKQREAIALADELYGATDRNALQARILLGEILRFEEEYAEAESIFREALALTLRAQPGNLLSECAITLPLAHAIGGQERYGEAVEMLVGLLEKLHAAGESDGLLELMARTDLAAVLEFAGDLEGAERMVRQCLTMAEALYDAGHWRRATTRGRLGRVLYALGETEEAAVELRTAHAALLEIGNENALRAAAPFAELLAEIDGEPVSSAARAPSSQD